MAQESEAPHPIPEVGDLIRGRYLLIDEIGEGGTAVVWRAVDARESREVALKLLLGRRSRAIARRLLREARVMMQLSHPHIVRVRDAGVGPYGPWYVMDLAVCSVEDELCRAGPLGLPLPRALLWILQMMEAVEVAHERGIVHRDIKPSNFLLFADGEVRLADFGIALVRDANSRDTRVGATMGSMAYMAPEQRLDAANVGVHADIHALGASLFHLVARKPPVDLFRAAEDSPRWTRVPEPLREVIRRAVRIEPEDRYPNVGEMAQALRNAAARLGIHLGGQDVPRTSQTMVPADPESTMLRQAPPIRPRPRVPGATQPPQISEAPTYQDASTLVDV